MGLGKAGEPDLTTDAVDTFEIGKSRYLRKGTDIAILSYGTNVADAFEISERLQEAGKSVSVISCHTIKPLDKKKLLIFYVTIRKLLSCKNMFLMVVLVPGSRKSLGISVPNVD